jgi:signal transduction histidine kinase
LKLDGPIPKLEADRVAHLVRIASEALNNAAQHGNARRIVLTCIADDARGELRIQDDGKGFAPDAASQDGREHFGLSIMRARAVRIGGQLSVTSTPGQGTLVCITWPLAWLQGNM